jgi:hypothetical protein
MTANASTHGGADAAHKARQLFEETPALLASDEDLVRRGRFLTADIEVGIGETPYAVRFENGRITHLAAGPFLLPSWVFAVRAEADTWLQLWQPVPAPGWHDLLALSKQGRLRIEGNLQPFMSNLQYVKDVLALPRRIGR